MSRTTPYKRKANGKGKSPAKKGRWTNYTTTSLQSPLSLGVEKKFIDYEYDNTISGALAGSEADPTTALALNATAVGDDLTNRNGRLITLKSVHVRGYVNFGEGTSNTDIIPEEDVKVVLLMDTQTNGAQFNAEDVFVDPTDNDLDGFTLRNLRYQKRFKVLATQIVCSGPRTAVQDSASPGLITTGRAVKRFEMDYEFKRPVQTEYTAATAVVASILTNSLHMLAVATPNSTATLRYFSRVRFVG